MEFYILLTQVIFHYLSNRIRFTDTQKKIVTLLFMYQKMEHLNLP